MPDRPFQYEPLASPTSIRVIAPYDDETGKDLCFRISQIDLKDPACASYRCLSYTWGNPVLLDNTAGFRARNVWAKRHTIYLVDAANPAEARYYSLDITTNLFDFLQELRKRPFDDVSLLWIDAISINQTDLQERASQVDLMGDIYVNCCEVIIWLGREGPETSTVLDYIDVLRSTEDLQPHRSEYQKKGRIPLRSRSFLEFLEGHGVPPISKEQRQALLTFFRRTWFHRVWTLQECILPPKGQLWCGSHTISNERLADDLESFPEILDEILFQMRSEPLWYLAPPGTDLSTDTYESLVAISQYLRMLTSTTRWQEEEGLEGVRPFMSQKTDFGSRTWDFTLRSKLCTDPRDKVFGSLGLQKNTAVRADYEASVHEVFIQHALREADRSGLLLWREDDSVRKIANLPSWVPDWSVPTIPVPWTSSGGKGIYSTGTAKGNATIEPTPSSTNNTLALEGFEEDTIIVTGSDDEQTIRGNGLLTSLDILVHACKAKDGLIERFWRTLIADLPGDYPVHPSSSDYGLRFRNFVLMSYARCLSTAWEKSQLWLTARSTINKLHEFSSSDALPQWQDITEAIQKFRTNRAAGQPPIDADVASSASGYAQSLLRMLHCRRFFITKKRRLGIGPKTLREGDRIFVVKGAEYPLVMRNKSDGSQHYLGLAYVEGIMHGEALNGRDFEKLEIS